MKTKVLALLAAWGALAWLWIAVPVQAAPPPVQAFFSYAQISEAQISPDGKYLAMVVADSQSGADRKGLAVLDLENHKITASFRTIGNQDIYRYWWANNERLLIATAVQTGSLDSPLVDGKLYGINVDGSRLLQLTGVQPGGPDSFTHVGRHRELLYFIRMLYIPPDNARKVIVQAVSDVGYRNQPDQAYSLDIYDGDMHDIAHSPVANGTLITDNAGGVRLATGSDTLNGTARFYYRASGSTLDWKGLSTLYSKDDPADSPLAPLGFAADNHTVYWLGRTPSSTLGLFALDPDTLKTTLLYGNPDYDVNGVVWSFDWQPTRHIIAVTGMPGLPALHILDSNAPKAEDLASLYAAFPDQVVNITSNTRDGAEMVIYVHSDRNPGAYYLYNAKKGQVSLLFKALPGIDPKQMATMQPITFTAGDGITLHGYLTLPPGSSGKDLPLIINPHGGPHGIRDEWGWDPEAQFFAAHGYAWLQVNYRGSGGYGMDFQDIGYRHWGTSMQSDLADAVHWAVKHGYADPKRICIYGASYGGYAALENSILYPDLYQCTVGYVGLYDLTLADRASFGHYASGRRYVDVVLGDDTATLKAESPVNQAGKIRDPLFLIYGGADQTVVPENASEMMSALDKAGKKYELMYERTEGHGFTKPEDRFELYTRMLAFFDKYIGPGAAGH